MTAQTNPVNLRIGHGYDIHRLQTGGRLLIGGVEVAQGMSPIAHSDGDVVLHALVDALLGAGGLGDIGEMFPNSDPKWKDVDSRIFVQTAMRKIKEQEWLVANADITILAEQPKLKPFKAKMVEVISAMIGAPVTIKAGTNERCDAIGAGEAVAAHAVVLLVRSDR